MELYVNDKMRGEQDAANILQRSSEGRRENCVNVVAVLEEGIVSISLLYNNVQLLTEVW